MPPPRFLAVVSLSLPLGLTTPPVWTASAGDEAVEEVGDDRGTGPAVGAGVSRPAAAASAVVAGSPCPTSSDVPPGRARPAARAAASVCDMDRTWARRLLFHKKFRLHRSHEKGASWVCSRVWASRFDERWKVRPHPLMTHRYSAALTEEPPPPPSSPGPLPEGGGATDDVDDAAAAMSLMGAGARAGATRGATTAAAGAVAGGVGGDGAAGAIIRDATVKVAAAPGGGRLGSGAAAAAATDLAAASRREPVREAIGATDPCGRLWGAPCMPSRDR